MTRSTPRIALIVAVAENGVIGRDGTMPWRLSSDLKYFRRLTMGKPVIMGRRTFQSIGRPLDGRDNIVITCDRGFAADGVTIVRSPDDALERAAAFAEARGADEIMVIGGGTIYAAIFDRADRLYLTEVHAAPDGDTKFPDFERHEWREISRQRFAAGAKDSAAYSLVVYERKR